MLHSVLLVLVAGCLSACSSGATSASPSSGASTPSTSAGAATQGATPNLTAAPGASGSRLGPIVATVADDLRVRSMPRVSDDSIELEPVLPVHTRLIVLDGPVTASGYTWYEVAPLGSRTLPIGWVAAGSRSGEPWLATADFDCPAIPADFQALAALVPAVGLACFPRVPITVRARLIRCNCDVDSVAYTPSWFSIGDPRLLVEPGATRPPSDARDWVFLYVDPSGEHPDVLPEVGVVELTGVFDHPAAADCTASVMGETPLPTQECRMKFAVSRLVVVGS